MSAGLLAAYARELDERSPVRWSGRVLEVTGNLIASAGPFCRIGEACEITGSDHRRYTGEVVGFRGSTVFSMITEDPEGICYGDTLTAQGGRPSIRCGPDLIGRVIDAAGAPLDGGGAYRATGLAAIDGSPPQPLSRRMIREPLGSGVRAIDGFLTCGRGQRIGIFGGSGVGKSTLLGTMARGTAADVIVMALTGERGREVGEFLEVLGEEGRRRSVVVVSTSDQPPLLRLRAPLAATALAERFAADGKHVLLVVDSLTRFAMAQREIGLAAGEPPTAKGYTPSVLNKLARLVERAGNFNRGSISAFYTVLMEGDDQQDPVADTVRSLLDGHIILDRALSSRGHFPPIAVLDSLSRLMPAIASAEHMNRARGLRALLAAHRRSEDLIRIGAYTRGTDAELDRAIDLLPGIHSFLQQRPEEICSLEESCRLLREIGA